MTEMSKQRRSHNAAHRLPVHQAVRQPLPIVARYLRSSGHVARCLRRAAIAATILGLTAAGLELTSGRTAGPADSPAGRRAVEVISPAPPTPDANSPQVKATSALPEPGGPATAPAAVIPVRVPVAVPVAVSRLTVEGIPDVAMRAYRYAAGREATIDPGCGISWTLLAAIGRVESNHGRFGGSVVLASGVSTPKIIGIALNGNGTEVVRDTDSGRLDGDSTYDRAVGPMQFIPSTWASYGVDANSDHLADPFNVYDAAAAAGHYLCAAGGDLRGRAGQIAAVLAYNHSDSYLATVLSLASAYAAGQTTGTIPVVTVPKQPPVKTTMPPADPRPSLARTTTSRATTAPHPRRGSAPTSPARTGSTATPTGSGTTTKATPPATSATSTATPTASPSTTGPGSASTSPPCPSASPSTASSASPSPTSTAPASSSSANPSPVGGTSTPTSCAAASATAGTTSPPGQAVAIPSAIP